MAVTSTQGSSLPNPLTHAYLADDAVEDNNIKDGEVKAAEIAENAVTTTELADDAVETLNIKDANVTAAKLSGADFLKEGGSDTEGSSAGTTSEVTLATVTIAADTFTTGMHIFAAIHMHTASPTYTQTFKLKSGATGSETLHQTTILHHGGTDAAAINEMGGSMLFYDAVSTFSAEVTVLITGQCSSTNGDSPISCMHVSVVGV